MDDLQILADVIDYTADYGKEHYPIGTTTGYTVSDSLPLVHAEPAEHTADSVRQELRGQVFQLGPDGGWATRGQYLSGDVVEKLARAREWAGVDPAFAENVAALEGAQPARVGIADITVPFGATWVGAEVYRQFLRHLFPAFDGYGVTLEYVAVTGTWLLAVSNKYLLGSVENTRTLGTPRISGVDLFECGLRLQQPVIYDDVPGPDGMGTVRQKNAVETAAAGGKLAELRERWAAWLPKDAVRAQSVEDAYNSHFNRWREREYDGSKLTFPGLSETYQGRPLELRPHQRAGALRMIERGEVDDTCLLAYFPGAGKSMCAIVGAVKRLQMGLSKKALFIVPKNTLHQWQQFFHDCYPTLSEWLLAGTDRAFDALNRRRFLLNAALGDAKIVLLTYEQFRAIPLKPETFRAYLKREVDDLAEAIEAAEDAAESDGASKHFAKNFKAKMKKLADFEAKMQSKWDKVVKAGDADVCWERWNVDLLITDECHLLKNDTVITRQDGVSGLPTAQSNRAFDGRVKLHYLTTPDLFPGLAGAGGGKAVGLTGTPVTNTLAEVWVMMRLFQPNLLRRLGFWHFDAWASTFTTPQPSPEMTATGEWKVRTRLKFHNLPELQRMLCWDRVDPSLMTGRPQIVGGRMRVVETPGSDSLREYVQHLATRAEAVAKKKVDPEEDNMLLITHDGRCASVFNGPPQKTWPTDRVTKLDAVAREVWDLYCHSDAMSGVQLIFIDLFTPKCASDAPATTRPRGETEKTAKLRALAKSTHSAHEAATARKVADELASEYVPLTAEELFLQQGVYGVLRDKLVAAGCMADEVAYIHDASSDEERRELFARANAGEIRVLIGSTARMGLGVNVQRRAYAAHHVTVPWRPDWLDQANKRVDRDGNTMEAVHLVCYPTIGSYDVVLWQMIEIKSEFVAAINSGTYAGRSADDIGNLTIDATTAKAVALGDLRVIEKVKLELELGQLQRQYKVWKTANLRSRFELESLPRQLEEKQREITDLTALKDHRDAHQLRSFAAKIRAAVSVTGAEHNSSDPSLSWTTVTDRTQADQRVHVLADSLRHRLGADGLLVGQYRGLDLLLVRDAHGIHLEARHGADGESVVAKNVHQRGGVGAFAQIESLLATLETSIHRLTQSRTILAARHESLKADAPAWSHADRVAGLLVRYEDLCAAVASNGIVDRQVYSF